ncbi:OmpA family protein [Neptuniibacter halophilus]|uniref:OmpA family protein n=1 Tax=Neptuniibacter halophilus TaxID=651666 RepID=UPI002573BCEC|nr:OmpA family protein [Neptuniibacter halophilus]
MSAMIKYTFLTLAALSASGVVNAAKYWHSSDGTPLRDSLGECVSTNSAQGQKLEPGCDPMDRVILLPDAEGTVGAVIVSSGGKAQKVDSAFAAIHVGQAGELETAPASQQEVSSRFGQLLKEQPLAPASYTLRFLPGSATELTPDSAAVVQQLFADLEKRSAPEVRLIGHTDTVGSLQANDKLSRMRAQTVAEILVKEGVDQQLMEVTGRGERELAVSTADNVDNVDNRRVEISIR